MPFGSSETETLKIIPDLTCRATSSSSLARVDKICHDLNFKIGEVNIKFNGFGFKDDKLIQVFMQFNPKDYSYIKDVFIKKYGDPTDTKESTIKTKVGVEYENENLTWISKKIRLSLTKYSGSVDKSVALFVDATDMKERIKEKESGKEKAISDF